MRLLTLLTVALIPLVSPAAGPVVSGVPVGKRPGPYSFNIATGPQVGKPTCYICETGDNPGAILFARKLTPELAALARRADAALAKLPEEAGRAWLTVLGEKTASPDELATWATHAKLTRLPAGIFDDPAGPPSYLLAPAAEVTVLLFKGRKVVANAAYRPGELTEAEVAKLGAAIEAHFAPAK